MNKILSSTILLAVTTWGFAQSALALPKLRPGDSDALGKSADDAAHLYQDATDADLYYVTPKRVVPVVEALSGRKLFSLSVSTPTGTAELDAVLSLGFNPDLIAKAWADVVARQPRATIKQLDIIDGQFGIEMLQDSFSLLIGKGELVTTSTGVDFPVHIELNRNGLFLLQAQAAKGSLAAISLTFSFGSTFQVDGATYQFSANLRGLLLELAADPAYAKEWQQGDELSEFALKRFLITTYSKGLWQAANAGDTDFDLNIASYLFYLAVDDQLRQSAGPEFELRKKSILSLNSALLPEGFSILKRTDADHQVVLRDSAAMSIRGLCDNYADAVYEEVSGESRCLTLVGPSKPPTPSTPAPPDDGVYTPDF